MTEICQDDAMVGARTAAPRRSTTKPYSSALRDRQVAQTRELILDAVTTLLGDRRADEVTTREIAAVAGVSERTVYRHFPDRDALLEGLSLRVSGIDGVKRATAWHTDSTFEDALPLLAMLHAKEVPSEKGGTMFADMRAAWDALPEARKRLLSGLTGLHGRTSGPAGERLYGDDKGATDKTYAEVRWPAVTRHPVTGRSILFVNPMHTHGFVGMERAEAWRLIEELGAHATQDRLVYYHRWRVGDLLMWDERATMHRGAGDYRPDERRIMLRTIVYPS